MARTKLRNPKRTQKSDDPQVSGGLNWWVFGVGALVVAVVVVLSLVNRETPDEAAGEGQPGEQDVAGEVFGVDMQWSEPPAMQIDPDTTDYAATISLPIGDIVIDLFEQESPVTVNNFVFLAEQGFYDGITFHRVLDGFMAQAGDPTGSGSGGPGYRFEDEVDNGLAFDRPYLLAMANAGPNTNGSQFFITFVETPHLNGAHTIFGEVVEGQDVVDSIPLRDPFTAAEPGMAMMRVTIDETPR